MFAILPVRLPQTDETARLLGFDNAGALKKAREVGRIPREGCVKVGARWYYLPYTLMKIWEEQAHDQAQKQATTGADVGRDAESVQSTICLQAHKAKKAVQREIASRDDKETGRDIPQQAPRVRQGRRTAMAKRKNSKKGNPYLSAVRD
jgi:hypothetical protein